MTAIAVVNSMILASAGTGKTFELSNRYIRPVSYTHLTLPTKRIV